jgi:hypothetical protein
VKSRAGKAFAAALMHLIFGAINLYAWCATWFLLAFWLMSGRDDLGQFIKRYGKAEDQAANAWCFDGHPKETISSHAGRWILAEREGRISRAPWWAHFVAWLTGLFEQDHVIKAIEEPFRGLPLTRE